MTDQPDQDEPRAKTRVDYSQPVKIRYRRFQDFIHEVSTNISPGGMFIAATEPADTGTVFEFELALEDGFTLIAGRAEVVWVRPASEGPAKPVGMGVRFVELRGASRRLVTTIVEKRARERQEAPDDAAQPKAATSAHTELPTEQLATPVAAGHAAPAPDDVPTEKLELDRTAVAAKARPWAWVRLPLLVVGSAALGGLIVLLFHLVWVQPRLRDLERRVESIADRGAQEAARRHLAAAAPEADDAIASSDGPVAAAGPVAPFAPVDPLGTVMAWARAWSEGNVEEYLGFYAEDFSPSGDLGRAEWEAMRRGRIARQSGISVAILMAEVEELSDASASVRFVQSYRSDTYSDRVRKTLRLARDEVGWRIVAEEVVRALPD